MAVIQNLNIKWAHGSNTKFKSKVHSLVTNENFMKKQKYLFKNKTDM